MSVNRLVVGRGVSQTRIDGTGHQSRQGRRAEERGDYLGFIEMGCLRFVDTSLVIAGKLGRLGSKFIC